MQHIRTLIALAIALILMAGCGVQNPDGAQSQPQVMRSVKANSDLELALEIPKQKYVTGKEYYAKLSLKNLGDDDLTFDMGRLFGISVLDRDNNTVWPDGTIPRLKGFHPVTIAKGKTHKQELLFTVDNPGTYSIVCRLAGGTAQQSKSGRVKIADPPELKTTPIAITVE